MAGGNRTVLDSDVLIDLARGHPPAIELVDHLIAEGERPAISIVTEMELFVGARTRSEQRLIGQLARRLLVLPISEMISLRARNLVVRYGLSRGLTIPDALIAATTIAARAQLLTRNVRHFSYLPSLRVRIPYA
jgi:predicted nucleic acid-binding protein